MNSADFNALEVYEGEEFGSGMTLNGDEAQLGFDFGAILSTGVDTLYEAQKKLLGAQKEKLQAQAIKTTGDVISEQAAKLLAQPEVKKLVKEQAEEIAIQKAATKVREGYAAFKKSPGKYLAYFAGATLLLAVTLRYLSKRK